MMEKNTKITETNSNNKCPYADVIHDHHICSNSTDTIPEAFISYEDHEKGNVTGWFQKINIEEGMVNFETGSNRLYIPINKIHIIKKRLNERIL